MSADATHRLLAPAFGRVAVAGHGAIADAVAGGFERAAYRLLPVPVGAAGQEQQQGEGEGADHEAHYSATPDFESMPQQETPPPSRGRVGGGDASARLTHRRRE